MKRAPLDFLAGCCCRRSTAICAAVCHSWHSVAEEDCLWQRHICYEFFRPGLLAYSAAYLGGWKQPESGCTAGTGGATAAAAASKILLHATHQGPEATAHHQPQHGLLKQLFSVGLVGRARPAASSGPATCAGMQHANDGYVPL